MQLLDFYHKIEESPLPVFSIKDISRIINKPANYTKVYISRAKQKGIIQSIGRGKYCKSETPIEVIASNIVFPSYISFLSALNFHGLTSQIPIEIQVVTLKQKKLLGYQNYFIKFVHFQKKRFFGYTHLDNVFIADIEKTLVDGLYLANSIPLDEIISVIQSTELNINKIIDFAIAMDSNVLLKRLGYILNQLGFTESRSLLKLINNKIDPLNPALSLHGTKEPNWNLQINEELF